MTIVVGGREMVTGVDISNWQNKRGPIDFDRVAGAGHKFVCAKASEGASYADPFYKPNRTGTLDAGMVFGAYHFMKSGSTWQSQVNQFLGAINNGQDCRFLMCDAEDNGLTDDQVVKWCEAVQTATKLPVTIYCGAYTDPVWRSAGWLKFDPWLASYTANYTTNPDPTKIKVPTGPRPWNHWTIWQYTSSGIVPGIEGPIDMNVATVEWFTRISGVQEDDEMAQPYFQRTSDNHPHLIFPDTGIRVDYSTLDGTTGETQVSIIKYVSAMAGKPIEERAKITDPSADFLITRSYQEIPNGPAIVKILLDAIKKVTPDVEIDYDAVGDAVLDAFKEQFNK